MGFFSWITSDTQKPVRNRHTPEGATPCKMIAPDGREWIEENYEGYGVFGGQDYHELLTELNAPYEKEVIEWGKRDLGIELDFSGDKTLIIPKIVSRYCRKKWDELPDSRIAPCQGYFW